MRALMHAEGKNQQNKLENRDQKLNRLQATLHMLESSG
jgi:hypothetical protein